MMTEPWKWTYEDLQKLIGQTESINLEFKQSKLFEQSREKITLNLTKEVSAFANTEGGVLVIGVVEEKVGKTRIASRLDEGVSIEKWSPEMIQQIIESNVRPHLAGLRVKSIPTNNEETHFIYTIYVPQGHTAYQASDHRYYSRSEYACNSLLDNEIRLRMFRGKVPHAIVQIENIQKVASVNLMVEKKHNASMGEQPLEKPIVQINSIEGMKNGRAGQLSQSKQNYADRKLALEEFLAERFNENSNLLQKVDELESTDTILVTAYSFDTVVKNVGEVNITEFKVKIDFPADNPFYLKSYTKVMKEGWLDRSSKRVIGLATAIADRMQVNIYPQDTFVAERNEVLFFWDQNPRLQDLQLHWTLFLSNTFPIEGEIVLEHPFDF